MSQTYRIGTLNFTGSQAILSASLDVSGSGRFTNNVTIANSNNGGVRLTTGGNPTIVFTEAIDRITLTRDNNDGLNISNVGGFIGHIVRSGWLVGGTDRFDLESSTRLKVTGDTLATSSIARGINLESTLTAAANNDTLIGLDVNPTFANGAFTGVNNIAARITGNVVTTGSLDVSGSIRNNSLFSIGQSGGTLVSNVNNTLTANFSNTQMTMGPNSIQFDANTTGEITFSTASTGSRLIIKNNGNIGIGNPSPSASLDVVGSGRFTDGLSVTGSITCTSDIAFAASGQRMEGNAGVGNWTFRNSAGQGWYFEWLQNGSTAMLLSPQNNLLLGTTDTSSFYRMEIARNLQGSGSLKVDTTLYVTGSRVGINTPTPLASLDVSGSGRFTGGLNVTDSGSVIINTSGSDISLAAGRNILRVYNNWGDGVWIGNGIDSSRMKLLAGPGQTSEIWFETNSAYAGAIGTGTDAGVLFVNPTNRFQVLLSNDEKIRVVSGSTGARMVLNSSSSIDDGTTNFQVSGSGRFTGGLTVTGSTTINDILILTPRTTTPNNPVSGSIIVSGSGATIRPYFWDGTAWTQMFT